jgi:MYXO-CTERM domain-containing protein
MHRLPRPKELAVITSFRSSAGAWVGAAVLGLACLAWPAAAQAAPTQPMRFYGQAQGNANCGGGAQLHVIAKNPNTVWTATRLDTSAGLGGGTLANAYDVGTLTGITTAYPFVVVTSDVAYVLLTEVCATVPPTSGALTYPADDGTTTVGARVVFYATYAAAANNFIAGVTGSPQVTMRTAGGAVVLPATSVPAGTAIRPPALTAGTVYVIDATGGTITAGSTSPSGYAVLAAADSAATSCQNDSGKTLFASFLGNGSTTTTGLALFNDTATAATVSFTPLLGGAAFANVSVPAGNKTYSTGITEGVYLLSSTSAVSAWAGSPKGPNTIDNLGDDIGIAIGRWDGASAFRVRARNQAQTSHLFARAGAQFQVNGAAAITVPAAENVTLATAPATDIVVTSAQPFLLQTQGAATPMNDWGKWLRPLPPVDSDGDTVSDVVETSAVGSCQSVAPDFDVDGYPDFLDLDSDNDCVPDSSPQEAGAARTNPALPAGAHCSGATPVCVVSNGAGTCTACSGNFGSGGAAACPTATLPSCQAGACVACNGSFGSGASLACTSAATPVCNGSGACVACDGDFGGATPAACALANLPYCSAGQCLACGGGNGSGAAQACKTTALPVCTAAGACVLCQNGYGSGLANACEVAAAPVCKADGTCNACNGDNGQAGATLACPTTASPYCTAGGTCGKCTSAADCNGHPNGPLCDSLTGACGTACGVDGDCTATQWCATATCTAKTPNGQPVPNVPPIGGACNDTNGARVCLSGVCSAVDNTCGRRAGEYCNLPDGGLSDGECQSGACTANGTCGACAKDSDCGGATSGKVCTDATKLCTSGCRGSGGNGCPPGQLCSSTSTQIGTCAVPEGGVDAGHDAAPPPNDAGGFDASPPPEDAGFDATFPDAAPDGGEPAADDTGVFEGGGIACSTSPGFGGGPLPVIALGLLGVLGLARRRKR